jgi:hypothetical protein
MRKRLAATALIFLVCLSLGGCLLNPPNLYYEPETAGGVAKIILRVAFVKPWILLPALWRGCSNPDEFSFEMFIFVFFVGGIHFVIGAISMALAKKLEINPLSSKETKNLPTETKNLPTLLVLPAYLLVIAILGGTIMGLYGLFIWGSCLIVSLLGFLL